MTTVVCTWKLPYRYAHSIVSVTCEALNLENGEVTYNESVVSNRGYPFGTMASFTCNCGYSLSELEPVTCRIFGHWCWEPPTCNQCKRMKQMIPIYFTLIPTLFISSVKL